MALSLSKKLSVLFRGITSTHNGNLTHLEQKISLKSTKMYVKIMIIAILKLKKIIKY